MYNLNSKTKLKWIFAFVIALLFAITGFILSSTTEKASAADDEIHTEFYYAESAHSKGFAYNTGFSTNINNSSAVLSKTYYIELAERTYNQLDSGYNHLVVCWGRKDKMDILANHFKYDSEVGDPSFMGQSSFLLGSELISARTSSQFYNIIDVNWWVYSEFPSYATFPCIAYRVQQSDIIDERSVGGCLWLPITVTWAEGSLFDIGIWLTYQYSTNSSKDTRINAYYTDSTIVSTVQSRVRIASSYSQDVAGAYEKALGIYRGGETDVVFSYLKPVQGHFNTAEQAQGTVRVPSVYVPDENYVKNQILQSNYANGRGLSGFNVEYNPTTAYSMTSGQVGHLDLLSPRIIRQATGISYGYSFGNSIPLTVNCPITYSDYTYSNFYVKLENSKNPNEYVENYFENDLQIDVYYTSYAESNGRMYLYYDYDQIITLIGNTLHWSVQRDYFDLTISGSYNSSLVSVGDYIVNGENRGKYVSFLYSTSDERQSQNCLFGLEITGTAPITVPVELNWTVVYEVLDNDLNTSTATLSVGQFYDNEFGSLENEILDRNGRWASYIYGSILPSVLNGVEFMRPVNLFTGRDYIDYDTLTATAYVEYAYNTSVLVIDNNLNSDIWIVQLPDTVSALSLLDLGVKSKIPEGYRVGRIAEMDTGLRIHENCAENPLNTTFYRVDSVRTEPYVMTVFLTDKWPITINYLEQWKTSPFAIMNEFTDNVRVADYPSDENGNLVLSGADVSEILGKDVVILQFLEVAVKINEVKITYDEINDKYVVDLVYTHLSLLSRDYSTTAEEIKVSLTPFSMWCDFYGKDWSLLFLNNENHRYFSSVDIADISPEQVYGFFSYVVFKDEIHNFSNWLRDQTGGGVSVLYSMNKVKGSGFYRFLNETAGVFALTGGTIGLMFGHPIVGTAVGSLTWYSLASISEAINDENGTYYTYFFFLDGTTDLPWITDTGATSRDDDDSALKNRAQSLIDDIEDALEPLGLFVKIVLGLVALVIVVFLGVWAFDLIFGKSKKGGNKK